MALGDVIAALAVSLTLETAAFEKGATIAEKRLEKSRKNFEAFGKKISGIGRTMSLAVTAPLLAMAAASIEGAKAQAEAMGQVNAALKSMGNGAGRTSEQLLKASDAMELRSLHDGDEILRKVTANMLTFGSIAGENFDRAQQAALDLATRMGGDLQSATLMIGKALNDPAKGLAALRRVGIQFTEQQENQIKAMVKVGNTAGAQAVMLKELERQFGGSAQAAADTAPWRKVQVIMGQLGDTIGEKLLPHIERLADRVTKLLERFQALSPETQNFIITAAGIAAALGPLLMVLGPIIGLFGKLLPLLAGIGTAGAAAASGTAAAGAAAATATGLLLPLSAAALAVYAAWKNWDKIAPILSNWAAGVSKNIASANNDLKTFGDKLKETDKQLGVPFKPFPSQEYLTEVGRNMASFNAFLASIGPTLKQWDANIIAALDIASLAVAQFYRDVKSWMIDKLNAVWNGVKAGVDRVKGFFRNLWDAVVGNSYIPDMVDGIGQHMARLDALMVVPAKKATEKTAEAFSGLKNLLDRLFPEQARHNQFVAELEKLQAWAKATKMPVDQLAEAIRRLKAEYADDALGPMKGISDSILNAEAPETISSDVRELADLLQKLHPISEQTFGGMSDRMKELGRDINGVIEHGLKGMMRGFGSLKDIALNVLYAIGDAIIENLLRPLSGMGGSGGIGGAIASAIGGLFGGGNSPDIIGMARGGSGIFGGFGGTDRNLLSLNGNPIAKVSRGEHFAVSPQGGGGGNIIINQTFAPNFAGNAATKEDLVRFAGIVKQDTITTFRDMRSRGAM